MDAVFAPPTAALLEKPDAARFQGMKLTLRSAFCVPNDQGRPQPLHPYYAPEVVQAALQDFRREATEHLFPFARHRLVPGQVASTAAAKRAVAGHDLVATFIMPPRYGGTLHHRNMALMTAKDAAAYEQMLDGQVQVAKALQGRGATQHVQVLALPEMSGKDFELFVLPQQNGRLVLPLQSGAQLFLDRKPGKSQQAARRKAFRAASAEAATRLQTTRAQRRETNQKLRLALLNPGSVRHEL
ncbi:MAG: hypothetical protein KBA75_10070 [Alphaproteobacteria bacterium]|nr:hypothetical protein [Alphaproteobacteria bacterium]